MKCFPCLLPENSSKKLISNLASPIKISDTNASKRYQNISNKNDLITKILLNNKNIYSPKFEYKMSIDNKTFLEASPQINKQFPKRYSKNGSEVSETNKRYTSSYRKLMVNTLRQIPKREPIDDNIFNNYYYFFNFNMIKKNKLTNLMFNTYKNNEKLNKRKNKKKNINININFIIKYNKYLSYINDIPVYNTLSSTSSSKNKKSKKNQLRKKFHTINCHSQSPKKYDICTKKNSNLINSSINRINNLKSSAVNLKKKQRCLNKNFSVEFPEKSKIKILAYKIQSPKYIGFYKNKIQSPKNRKSDLEACSSYILNLNNCSSTKINPFLNYEEILARTHKNMFGETENKQKLQNNDSNNTNNTQYLNLENKNNIFNKDSLKLKKNHINSNLMKIKIGKKNNHNENKIILGNAEKMKNKNVKKLKEEKNILSLTFTYKSKEGKNPNVSLKNNIRNVIIK